MKKRGERGRKRGRKKEEEKKEREKGKAPAGSQAKRGKTGGRVAFFSKSIQRKTSKTDKKEPAMADVANQPAIGARTD